METLQKTALVLTIIGAINWALVGLFDYNLVTTLLGSMDIAVKVVYFLIGLAGLINIGILFSHIDND